jgi:hypothetical protein
MVVRRKAQLQGGRTTHQLCAVGDRVGHAPGCGPFTRRTLPSCTSCLIWSMSWLPRSLIVSIVSGVAIPTSLDVVATLPGHVSLSAGSGTQRNTRPNIRVLCRYRSCVIPSPPAALRRLQTQQLRRCCPVASPRCPTGPAGGRASKASAKCEARAHLVPVLWSLRVSSPCTRASSTPGKLCTAAVTLWSSGSIRGATAIAMRRTLEGDKEIPCPLGARWMSLGRGCCQPGTIHQGGS